MAQTHLLSLPLGPDESQPLSEQVAIENLQAHSVAKPLFRNEINLAAITWKKGYHSWKRYRPKRIIVLLHLQGEMKVFLHQNFYQLKPMDVVLVPPGTEFEMMGTKEVWAQWAYFYITPSKGWENLVECGPLVAPYDYGPMIYFLLRNILNSHKNSANYPRALALGDGWILSRALKRISILNPPKKQKNALSTLAEEIKAQPKFHWAVENMAKRLHVSRNTLFRMFKQKYGLSPKQFIIETKMKSAANSLVSTDAPIDFIAGTVGYLNVYTFTRIFSQFHGCPPGSYRKKHQAESLN